MKSFMELSERMWRKDRFVCVGLDVNLKLIPNSVKLFSVEDTIFVFNKAIIVATAEYCGGFKPNYWYYAQYGAAGLNALKRTIEFIQNNYPLHIVILDGKFGDVKDTIECCVEMAFREYKVHGVTVNPYLGKDALKPFLDHKEAGIFILCHTSNKGANEFQELNVSDSIFPEGHMPLYRYIANNVTYEEGWNYNENCGFVFGATFPEELKEIRETTDLPLLIPGIGKQGGDLEKSIKNSLLPTGKLKSFFNASRSIIYASSGDDFATAAETEAFQLDTSIRRILKEIGG